MGIYRAEIEDDNFEIIRANDEQDAINQYFDLEEAHELLGLVELDENYNEIKTII